MIELTYAIGEKAGSKFAVRAATIVIVEPAKAGAGALITIAGGRCIAVLESDRQVRQLVGDLP